VKTKEISVRKTQIKIQVFLFRCCLFFFLLSASADLVIFIVEEKKDDQNFG